MLPKLVYDALKKSRLSRLQTGEAFLFALVISLVEKVKQRKEKTTSRKRQYQDS